MILAASVVRFGVLSLAVLSFASCSPRQKPNIGDFPDKIALSDQYGLAYAPVNAARLLGWFEEELPETEFEWKTVGNATAIREAMIAGRLDGGFMGIPPYLIGRDRGMKWNAVTAISQAQLGLVTLSPNIHSLSDFKRSSRIALPQPGSIQHILLSMAAEKELGDSRYFDDRLVSLNHPDGMNALLAGSEISAHFSSTPYLQTELAQTGATLVLDGNQAFGGPFTFIIFVLSNQMIDEYPVAVTGLRKALDRATIWMVENPGQAAELLSRHYNMEVAELSDLFRSDAVIFNSQMLGMNRFAEFMAAKGYLKDTGNTDALYFR